MSKTLLIAFVVLIISGLSGPAMAGPETDAVFARIADRLALMKPVAAWKRARSAAVEDLAREAVVLEKATRSAADVGLVAETARPFFQAQITAAKEIQTCWIGRWDRNEAQPPDPVPDLKTEIRPKLIKIGAALLSDIKDALEAGASFDAAHSADFLAKVKLDCLSAEGHAAIFKELGGLRLAN